MAEVTTPLRVAVLTSHSAPGLEQVIAHSNRGALFDIVGVISSDPVVVEAPAIEAAGIPLVLRPLKIEMTERGLPLRNLRVREDYDAETADLLQHWRADYVFLVGYNYIVTPPLVNAFPQRLLALHDGDLMLRDENGHRRYAGLHAVREAVFAGETETRAAVYFVTQDVGAGPLLILSKPFRVAQLAHDARTWGAADLVSDYAGMHRRWMLRAAWGEMIVRAIECLAAGSVSIVRDIAWIDGVPGPCRLGEAPAICKEREPGLETGIPASCPLIRD